MAKPLSSGVLAFRHSAKSFVAVCVEGGELGVAEDGGLHLGDAAASGCAVAGAVGCLEQRGAHAGQTFQ